MARTVAALPAGSRITDYISLGVIAKFFPREKVDAALDLPADHDHPGSQTGPGERTGGAVSRTVGDRDCAG